MRPPLLTQCFNLDVHLYYVAIQNVVYGCGNVLQTAAESSDTPPIHCAQHVQQYVNPASCRLTMRPHSNGELRQQVQDAWDNLMQDVILAPL